MIHRDDLPETPEWQGEPKPWDSERCCPTECTQVCETAQHALFIHGEDWWMSDYFTLGND